MEARSSREAEMYLKPYCESLDYLVSLTHLLHLLSTGLVQLEWTSIVYVPTVIPIALGGRRIVTKIIE